MRQENCLQRFKRRIKTKPYRLWLGKRILVCTTAVAVVSVPFLIGRVAAQSNDETPQKVNCEAVEKHIKTVVAFPYYDVPLDEDLQLFIVRECEKHHIDAAIIMAMIEHESEFKADAIGDNGHSHGLMQIQERFHLERMKRLGCDDLLDPYQNVQVGIDYLAEQLERYGDIEKALVAYNAGPTGAYNNWFSRGVYSSDYSSAVIENSQNITKGTVFYALHG